MKKYQLHTKTEDIVSRFPALSKRLVQAERTRASGDSAPAILSIGADLEKAGACLAIQCGLSEPVTLGTVRRETVLELIPALIARGWRCLVGVEACGFGWRFQREMRAAGAEVFTVATEALTGRRKTNKRDAQALARLISNLVIHGNSTAGRIVREPTREEQQRRHLSRHRSQLVALRGKIEAQGRGLLYDHGRLDFPECWWGKKMWPRLKGQLEADDESWLLSALAPQRDMAQMIHAQILELDQQLAELAATELAVTPLPQGLGQLTALTACLEVMNWQRFNNRKQAGSYIGCCPSENSTGGGQNLGGIDRQGNRRLRSLLTEAIWRLIRWEPGWHVFAKWGPVIRDSGSSSVRKKKAVIACVRLLFIDLWRLFTGRATLADLGFHGLLPKAIAPEESAAVAVAA